MYHCWREQHSSVCVQLAQCPPTLSTQTPYGKAVWGLLMECHQTWPCLGSCTLGTHCHPRASGFPSCPLMHDSVRSLFCAEITVGKRLQESSWQAPNLEKLLSALSPSTHSFHFLLTGAHPPSPASVCSAPSLPSQPWHFPGSGCWFGSTEHPAGARELAHTLGAGVSAQCLPSACRCQCHYGAFSTWWGLDNH